MQELLPARPEPQVAAELEYQTDSVFVAAFVATAAACCQIEQTPVVAAPVVRSPLVVAQMALAAALHSHHLAAALHSRHLAAAAAAVGH